MEEPSALDRLAERMGIEPAYRTFTGDTVIAPEATKRALLAAMGVEVPDEAAARARLDALEAEEAARLLPPVLVVREDRLPPQVPLSFPAATGTVHWRLTEEEGGYHEGRAEFAALEFDRQHEVEGSLIEVRWLAVPGSLPLGYHRLHVEAENQAAEMLLIVVPPRCYLPAPLARGGRVWGIAAQLYTVRAAPDWGIGDFGDLQRLVTLAAAQDAAVVGLNPLHATLLDRPERPSPYSPASRLFLNPLYIDVIAIPELMACRPALAEIASAAFQERLAELQAAPFVDYAAITALKLPLLEVIFAAFREAAEPGRRAAFESFRRQVGEPLERFCLFQALREHFAAEDPAKADWQAWPEAFRIPDTAAVAEFRDRHRERIDFFAWLQWIADTQLAAAAALARGRGLPVGLYRDLAVGADPAGAETWSNPEVVVDTVQIGAPPDMFTSEGQNWELPPFDPQALRAEAYRSFIDLLRANMRHAGALRIDHIMGLQRLFWIPAGRPAIEGTYVGYPFDDLIGILALESHRHRCLVVGEDLGVLPWGFRERMTEAGLLSYRVVFFEWHEDGSFLAPDEYPSLALALVSSHDLPTLRGWWEERDIQIKEDKGICATADDIKAQREQRALDRGRLLDALRAAGLPLPAGIDAASPWSEALETAVHAFLGRTKAMIAMVQLDDLTGEVDQVNVPGTVNEYPNWRRRLGMTLEELAGNARAAALMRAMAEARGRVQTAR